MAKTREWESRRPIFFPFYTGYVFLRKQIPQTSSLLTLALCDTLCWFRKWKYFLPWLFNLFEGFRPLVKIPHICIAFTPTAVFGGYHFGPSWTLTARFHQVFRFLVLLRHYSLIHFPLSHPNVCLSLCGGSHGISCDKIYF